MKKITRELTRNSCSVLDENKFRIALSCNQKRKKVVVWWSSTIECDSSDLRTHKNHCSYILFLYIYLTRDHDGGKVIVFAVGAHELYEISCVAT